MNPLFPPPSIVDVQAIEKTKEIALREEEKKRESQFYLWRDWLACLQAEIPIRPVLGECVSMRCSASSSSSHHHHHHTHQRHPALNPSIARFICVSHYREWNVVPAKCINSKVGKLACCTACSRSLI